MGTWSPARTPTSASYWMRSTRTVVDRLDTWWTRRANKMPRSDRPENDESLAVARLARATGATGLEPATSGVTGRRSNQLSYAPGRWAKDSAPPPNSEPRDRVRRNLAAQAGFTEVSTDLSPEVGRCLG